MAFVLDASVALSWHFEDEVSDYAERVLTALVDESVIAPAVWALEVANGLALGERRGRLTSAAIVRAIEDTLRLPVVLTDYAAQDALRTVLALARRYALSAYDAAYLELAMREGLPLATQDNALRRAAGEAGVAIFDPA